jgi:CubicO group peptidase (beta-lactamase class C family)
MIVGWAIVCSILPSHPASAFAVERDEGSAAAFPGHEWKAAQDIARLGWSSDKLRAVDAEVKASGSSSLLIVTDGLVVASWGDVSRTFLCHSMRKSFMSALYGIYVADRKIDLSETLASLKITEKNITLTPGEQQARIIDLLRARSGVYLPAAGEVDSMRKERPERGSHAAGTFWYYNNWDFNVLGTIFRQQTGEDIFEALKSRIADPIGMQDFSLATTYYDYVPYSLHPAYWFRISARDLARFGLLYLSDGDWRGKQIVPKQWVKDSTTSYSAAESGVTKSGYGMLWWIAIRSDYGIPVGTYTASGNGGQRLTVIPAMHTVIANLMDTDAPGPRMSSKDWDRMLGKILQARLQASP